MTIIIIIIIVTLTAFGQINRIPGVWNPEWLRAYFIVYHPLDHPSRKQTSHLPAGVSYSVLFRYHGSNDEDIDDGDGDFVIENANDPVAAWRSHMIDFSISCWSGE